MSERNLELEMDEMKAQLGEILELLKGRKSIVGREEAKKKEDKVKDDEEEEEQFSASFTTLHGDFGGDDCPVRAELEAAQRRLDETYSEKSKTGRLAYLGVFASGGWKHSWIKHGVNTDELLDLIDTGVAGKVLSCIGNNDRLNILLNILKKPMTVSELVKKGGYNSTGQVYHHLKPLIAADLIAEDKDAAKGTYTIQRHKVRGIIMLLAGIGDMLDGSSEEATEWEAQADE